MTDSLADHEHTEAWATFYDEYCKEDLTTVAEELAANSYLDAVPLQVTHEDLEAFDENFAARVKLQPETAIASAKKALGYRDAFEDLPIEDVKYRFKDFPSHPVREITHEHLDTLVAVEGIVQQATDPQPRFTELAFECKRCESITRVPQSETKLTEPHQCRSCERQGPFETVTEMSSYIHHQRIRVQESPEGLRGGQDPRSIDVLIEAELVDMATPGDQVTVTGILTHPDPLTTDGNDPTTQPYIDSQNITTESESFATKKITDEEEERILDIARQENPTETVVNSIAPTIYGNRVEKLALALQMFSGVRKIVDDKTIRGNLHVFLVGDPGTAKSQLLQFVNETMPRASYTTGEGSSKAGLTGAAVQSDLGDGAWTIEAGVLVLSDQGIACVDELDKLDEGTDALHSALEQQKVSIAKAGINTTMNARCGLLSAANPKYGRWDEYEPIPEQVDLPAAIISRFDLIFTLKDKPDPDFDSDLANSILDTNQAGQKMASGEDAEDVEELAKPEISFELLPKYIMYARQEVTPVLTPEAKEKLHDFYVDMRSKGVGEDNAIPITARKLEALVRLAEASARIRLSEEITEEDAGLALDIVKQSLQQVGVDPETGEFDADMVETGTSNSQRDRIKNIQELIDEVAEEHENGAPEEAVYARAEDEGFDMDKLDHELDKLRKQGEVYEPSQGTLRTT